MLVIFQAGVIFQDARYSTCHGHVHLTVHVLPNLTTHFTKGMPMICKWPRHLIVLNFVNSGITINKMDKVLITFVSSAS